MIRFEQGQSYSKDVRWWLAGLALFYFLALALKSPAIFYLSILAGALSLVLNEIRSGVVLDSTCCARYTRGTREYHWGLIYHLCGVLCAGWMMYMGIFR